MIMEYKRSIFADTPGNLAGAQNLISNLVLSCEELHSYVLVHRS